MAEAKRARRPAEPAVADQIVDTAVAMAEEAGWQNLRLRRVAGALGISLDELRRHFRDLDAVADAWFDRASAAMLAPVDLAFGERPARERLHIVMLRWFDSLAAHRRVTVEMLTTKMWPFHPHHWVPMVFNLSRTVQWIRDAAGLDDGGIRRQLEEVGLTAVFLATLAVWARDESPGQERTRRFLDRRLAEADHLMAMAPLPRLRRRR